MPRSALISHQIKHGNFFRRCAGRCGPRCAARCGPPRHRVNIVQAISMRAYRTARHGLPRCCGRNRLGRRPGAVEPASASLPPGCLPARTAMTPVRPPAAQRRCAIRVRLARLAGPCWVTAAARAASCPRLPCLAAPRRARDLNARWRRVASTARAALPARGLQTWPGPDSGGHGGGVASDKAPKMQSCSALQKAAGCRPPGGPMGGPGRPRPGQGKGNSG